MSSRASSGSWLIGSMALGTNITVPEPQRHIIGAAPDLSSIQSLLTPRARACAFALACASRCRRSRTPGAAVRLPLWPASMSGPGLAIFEADHSSSPLSLLKIAAAFLSAPAAPPPRPGPRPCAAPRARVLSCAGGRAWSAAGWLVPPRARPPAAWRFRATAATAAGTRRARDPSALRGLFHGGGGDHGIQPSHRCPGPLASGPGQRVPAPTLPRIHSHTDLSRHHFQRLLHHPTDVSGIADVDAELCQTGYVVCGRAQIGLRHGPSRPPAPVVTISTGDVLKRSSGQDHSNALRIMPCAICRRTFSSAFNPRM
jgi:hypothetical protein